MESAPLGSQAQIDAVRFGRTLEMHIPASRAQIDFNVKPAMGIRAVKIDMGDIVEPEHRLSSRTKPPEKPPRFLQIIGRNPPVNMDEIGIDR
jgi:hypothetical protein